MARANDTRSYFSHDANARNSERLIKLRMRHGAAGYGIFFMIIERLREETEYMSVKDYNIIAFDLRVDASTVKSVVEDFGLFVFTDDGKYFYSESLRKRMLLMDKQKRSRAEAGRKAMEKRWSGEKTAAEDQTVNSNAITGLSGNGSSVITELPESDNNKIKRNKIKISPDGDRKGQPPPAPPESDMAFMNLGLDGQIGRLRGDSQWTEALCMKFSMDPESLWKLIDGDFTGHCIREGKRHQSMQDLKSHINRWINRQKQPTANGNYQPTTDPGRGRTPGKDEFRAHIAARLGSPGRQEPDLSGYY